MHKRLKKWEFITRVMDAVPGLSSAENVNIKLPAAMFASAGTPLELFGGRGIYNLRQVTLSNNAGAWANEALPWTDPDEVPVYFDDVVDVVRAYTEGSDTNVRDFRPDVRLVLAMESFGFYQNLVSIAVTENTEDVFVYSDNPDDDGMVKVVDLGPNSVYVFDDGGGVGFAMPADKAGARAMRSERIRIALASASGFPVPFNEPNGDDPRLIIPVRFGQSHIDCLAWKDGRYTHTKIYGSILDGKTLLLNEDWTPYNGKTMDQFIIDANNRAARSISFGCGRTAYNNVKYPNQYHDDHC